MTTSAGDWLTGRRVVVTRPAAQAGDLCTLLRQHGATPVEFPVINITPTAPGDPLDIAIKRLYTYDWVIFTSVNGVEQLWARLEANEETSRQGNRETGKQEAGELRLRFAAIGPATAAALRAHGAIVHLTPGEFRTTAILAALGDVGGQRILLPRADIATPELAEGLRERGAQVDDVAAYHTVPATPSPAAFADLCAGVDAIAFTSSSTVRNFAALTAGLAYGAPRIACIGPVTAATARELGLRVDLIAAEYTVPGLVAALAGQREAVDG